MPKSTVSFDFSDVSGAFARLRNEILVQEDVVGREAVDYAVRNGQYRDVTGTLRASNRYETGTGGLTLVNDAPYASDVEARGQDVLGGAALLAEKRLKEIFGQ